MVVCLEDKSMWRPFSMLPSTPLSEAVESFLNKWSLSPSILRKAALHVWVSRLGDDGAHTWISVEPQHKLRDFLHPTQNHSTYKKRLVMCLLTNDSMQQCQFAFNESDLDTTDDDDYLTKRAQPPVTTNVTLNLVHTRTGHEYKPEIVSGSFTTRDLKRDIIKTKLADNTSLIINNMSTRRLRLILDGGIPMFDQIFIYQYLQMTNKLHNNGNVIKVYFSISPVVIVPPLAPIQDSWDIVAPVVLTVHPLLESLNLNLTSFDEAIKAIANTNDKRAAWIRELFAGLLRNPYSPMKDKIFQVFQQSAVERCAKKHNMRLAAGEKVGGNNNDDG